MRSISVLLIGNGNVTLDISECAFFNGTAFKNHGGGIFLYVGIQSANIVLKGLQFLHNEAGYLGGGIASRLSGNGDITLVISNCDFSNGTALNHDGGGMYFDIEIQSANIQLSKLTFSHNKAHDSGGGISTHLSGNGNVTFVVSNCVFFNGTTFDYDGGGIYLE